MIQEVLKFLKLNGRCRFEFPNVVNNKIMKLLIYMYAFIKYY